MNKNFEDALAEEILATLKNSGGIKVRELINQVSNLFKVEVSQKLIAESIENLIKAKKIIEIEYSTDGYASMNSFLLPAKTQINIRGQEVKPQRVI